MSAGTLSAAASAASGHDSDVSPAAVNDETAAMRGNRYAIRAETAAEDGMLREAATAHGVAADSFSAAAAECRDPHTRRAMRVLADAHREKSRRCLISADKVDELRVQFNGRGQERRGTAGADSLRLGRANVPAATGARGTDSAHRQGVTTGQRVPRGTSSGTTTTTAGPETRQESHASQLGDLQHDVEQRFRELGSLAGMVPPSVVAAAAEAAATGTGGGSGGTVGGGTGRSGARPGALGDSFIFVEPDVRPATRPGRSASAPAELRPLNTRSAAAHARGQRPRVTTPVSMEEFVANVVGLPTLGEGDAEGDGDASDGGVAGTGSGAGSGAAALFADGDDSPVVSHDPVFAVPRKQGSSSSPGAGTFSGQAAAAAPAATSTATAVSARASTSSPAAAASAGHAGTDHSRRLSVDDLQAEVDFLRGQMKPLQDHVRRLADENQVLTRRLASVTRARESQQHEAMLADAAAFRAEFSAKFAGLREVMRGFRALYAQVQWADDGAAGATGGDSASNSRGSDATGTGAAGAGAGESSGAKAAKPDPEKAAMRQLITELRSTVAQLSTKLRQEVMASAKQGEELRKYKAFHRSYKKRRERRMSMDDASSTGSGRASLGGKGSPALTPSQASAAPPAVSSPVGDSGGDSLRASPAAPATGVASPASVATPATPATPATLATPQAATPT